jgi:hypothetical protein
VLHRGFYLAVAELVRPARALSPPGSMIAATVRSPDMAREPGLPAEGEQLSHVGIRVRWIARADGPVLSHRKQIAESARLNIASLGRSRRA